MKQLDQHIVELVLRYENVILPKLGCFTKSIEFSSDENHSFSKKENLSFTQNSKLNDGMLYKYVSIQLNVSLSESQTIVDQYISDLKIRVFNQERVQIIPLGAFLLSDSETISFSYNQNFRIYPEYNGLTGFVRQPIIRKTQSTTKAQTKKSRAYYWAAASLVPLLGLSIYFGINRQKLDPEAIPTTAGLSEISTTTLEHHFLDLTNLEEVNFSGLYDEQEENFIFNTNEIQNGYQIVLGVFGSKENAIKLAHSELNITNEVLIVPYKGMFKVSTLIYTSKKDAQKDLSKVRSFIPKAWLYKLK